ncbi:MAG: tRNA pseudouridine(13) synthase TruD [Gammaproteobacteria bacterium]|nr:tRNA pseudouridine(13) synthase TruD [Gammaproteobacteria bacterium]
MILSTSELPYAVARPHVTGVIRATANDFQVDEELGFEPAGKGEHVLLHIRKRNANTEWLARELARLAGVKVVDVGYAGLKDRKAVTSQWFSVNLAGRPEPDWTRIASDDIQFLAIVRHDRKLRRGALTGNRFTLRVSNLQGDVSGMALRLARIAEEGVPNYFGEQRFGHANLDRASRMFAGELRVRDRHQRSLYLSAVRSELFNRVLARRVAAGHWNTAVAGDVMMLDGTHSVFAVEDVDAEIARRVSEQDIHPTGPLWGSGELRSRHAARRIEEEALADCEPWRDGLEQAGLEQQRRALRLKVDDLRWKFEGSDSVLLEFQLPAGSYATVVLREIVNYSEC